MYFALNVSKHLVKNTKAAENQRPPVGLLLREIATNKAASDSTRAAADK
jgi:hypothetical protein